MTLQTDTYRDPRGLFLPGSKGGPGRPAVPEWLKGHSDALLKLQLAAATTGRLPLSPPLAGDEPEYTDDGEAIPAETSQVVSPADRLKAMGQLLDRLFGKPPSAPEDIEKREGGVEALLMALALQPK